MLDEAVTTIPGVGPGAARAYAKLGIHTVRDVLLAFPFRYDDFRATEGIASLQPGQTATVQGVLSRIRTRRSPKKHMVLTEATIEDATGSVTAVWFHQPYLAKTLHVGDRLSLAGKVDERYGLSLVNPQFERMTGPLVHTGRLVPVYATTGTLTQKARRQAVHHVLSQAKNVQDWMPLEVLDRLHVPSLATCVETLHFPMDAEAFGRAVRRLKVGELLLHQLGQQADRARRRLARAVSVPFDVGRMKQRVEALPFALTDAQRRAVYAAVQDMERDTPMHRLLEGDVGSGKTVVAALVLDQAVAAGYQGVYVAPTELLATQQAQALAEVLPDASVALFTQSQQHVNGQAVSRSSLLSALMDGRVDVVVGTHALLTQDVSVPKGALVVIDEQHRFGVNQRRQVLRFGPDGCVPHVLSMTATPIPRTLAMALYGDMDVSVLDELPPNRALVETILLRPGQSEPALQAMRDRLARGEQAYVVCPFIEQSEVSEAESVGQVYDRLRTGAFAGVSLAMLHGQMRAAEKEAVMEAFRAGRVSVLVSTTVVEVGVNVPNATMMFVEGAERFGLAQLHQLRGRVRRSARAATCFLHPSSLSGTARERLQAMTKTADGFALAELDLKLRGPGDTYGTRQSGLPEFEYASLSDFALIAQTQEVARWMVQEDVDHTQWPSVWRALDDFQQKKVSG